MMATSRFAHGATANRVWSTIEGSTEKHGLALYSWLGLGESYFGMDNSNGGSYPKDWGSPQVKGKTGSGRFSN